MSKLQKKLEEIKVERVMDILEDVKAENMDIYDITAVIVSDIHDMMKAQDRKEFLKQKGDLRKQLKTLNRYVTNKTFDGFKRKK